MILQNSFPPRIGLTKLTPVLRLLNISRGTFEKGVTDGTYPPPRVRSRRPGACALWDAAQIWAVVEGRDWREVSSVSVHFDQPGDVPARPAKRRGPAVRG